jgi:PAP2 superfamily
VVSGTTVDDYRWYALTKNKFVYSIGLIFAIFMAVTIGVSRFMLGAHSIDQVIYGWQYGLWFAFFMFRYARPAVQIHIRRLLETNTEDIAIHDQAAIRG